MTMIGLCFTASSTVLLDTTGLHLGVAFSSSTWTTKTSGAGIYGRAYQHHQQQRQRVLYQHHCQRNVLPLLSIVRAYIPSLQSPHVRVVEGSSWTGMACVAVAGVWHGVVVAADNDVV